jgi:hypothetical protein
MEEPKHVFLDRVSLNSIMQKVLQKERIVRAPQINVTTLKKIFARRSGALLNVYLCQFAILAARF